MKVCNVGHDNCILTEHNGKKYCFYKGIPVEITPEIYNNIVISGHVSAQDVVIYEEPKAEEEPKETIVEKVVDKAKEIVKLRSRPKGRK